jgi:hypothetical protein
MFDKIVKDECLIDGDLVLDLSVQLSKDDMFDITPYLSLPNATEKKIKALHKKHIERRKQSAE